MEANELRDQLYNIYSRVPNHKIENLAEAFQHYRGFEKDALHYNRFSRNFFYLVASFAAVFIGVGCVLYWHQSSHMYQELQKTNAVLNDHQRKMELMIEQQKQQIAILLSAKEAEISSQRQVYQEEIQKICEKYQQQWETNWKDLEQQQNEKSQLQQKELYAQWNSLLDKSKVEIVELVQKSLASKQKTHSNTVVGNLPKTSENVKIDSLLEKEINQYLLGVNKNYSAEDVMQAIQLWTLLEEVYKNKNNEQQEIYIKTLEKFLQKWTEKK